MGLTLMNFPSGIVNAGVAVIPMNGDIFYVNSATGQDSLQKGTTLKTPFKTLAYAMANARGLGSGDFIFIAPGHTEDITAAATIACAIAGVTVIGLGEGTSRPTFTFKTSTAATITITAANVRFVNCVFDLTGIASLVTGFSISAAGTWAIFERCMFTGSSAFNAALCAITTSGGSGHFIDCAFDFTGATTGGAQAIISGAAIAGFRVERCRFAGNFSVACIAAASTNHITKMRILESEFTQSNGTAKVVLSFTTGSTGLIRDNRFIGTTWATAADAIGANSSNVALRWFQNFGFDDGAGIVSGVLVPAAGTIA